MPNSRSPDASSPSVQVAPDELVDMVLAASRALVAVAARSLAAAGDEVTLPQYRALVVLAARGPQGTAELAAALAVNPSTATRMCDRLVRKGLVRRHGRPAAGAQVRRIALYEPPGPQTVLQAWRQHINALIAAGQPGRAMISFLTEIIGLTPGQADELKSTAGTGDILPVVTATMRREAEALGSADLQAIAPAVAVPVLLITGTAGPPWARAITEALHAAIPRAAIVTLPGQGHEAIDTAPRLVVELLRRFLLAE